MPPSRRTRGRRPEDPDLSEIGVFQCESDNTGRSSRTVRRVSAYLHVGCDGRRRKTSTSTRGRQHRMDLEDEPRASGAETALAHCPRDLHGFDLPRLPAMLRHALPNFVEGVIAPVAVFYAALVLLGFHGALIVA